MRQPVRDATDIPRPEFGPLARRALSRPAPRSPEIEKLRGNTEPPETIGTRRERLLASVSDHTLVLIDKTTPAGTRPDQTGIVPNLPLAANETDALPDRASQPQQDVPDDRAIAAALPALAFADTAPPLPLSPAAQDADAAPIADTGQFASSLKASGETSAETSGETSGLPDESVIAAHDDLADAPAALPLPPAAVAEAVSGNNAAEQQSDPVSDLALLEVPVPPASVPVPVPVPVPDASDEPASGPPAAVKPTFAEAFSAAADAPPSGETAAPQKPAARLAAQDAGVAPEPTAIARRSIPPRTEAPVTPAPAPKLSGDSEAKIPSLASVLPSKRTPIPMVSVITPVPEAGTPAPANDQTPLPRASTAQAPVAALVPAARTQTTLGLGQPAAPPPTKSALFGPDRNSAFTASAQPPALSYQDELILEVQIKGISANDTIIAYGTREGVYLPLGTLARILDVAISVSDEGHYASGWVLDQKNTLTIDLRQNLVSKDGKVVKLPPDLAAAFDGDLFLRSDVFAELLPLTIEPDLRSQSVIIETLQPFPFQERMEREADRRRLEARGGTRTQQEWPRSETPWLLASPPLADVELRAVSDRTFGPRVEGNIQLAGDLAFLTAQTYLAADTKFGLTASLIELGRQDPDADLLGPLHATAFSVGDVATVSMPIGLRSVSGRGFAVSNTPAEAVSVFERIDLRGILPDGYEIELYRNDILVGSTREAVNGQYEFLQVPVDFGLNIFRLVFFGPQGQRSEQVRRISVGDGRLPQGKLVYRIGAVQKDENVLGVRPPNFIAQPDLGKWRASAEVGYGLSSTITTVLGGSWYQTAADPNRWTASAGIRTGIGGFAFKGDIAAADGGAFAVSGGIGGRIGGSAVTLSHAEYSGDFIDETRSIGGDLLRRSTEFDFNTTLNLGNAGTGLSIPLTARARHVETTDGGTRTNAAIRASTRLPGLLASNTLEYTRTSMPQLQAFSQLFGNFDLATLGRSKTRGRVSLGYQVLPQPDIVSAAFEIDHAIDKDTAIRGSIGYAFQSKSTQIGLSAVRDFDRFTLALDGNYGFGDKNYSVGLRLGLSFGRDPLSRRVFIARPGLANSGGASLRAFQDMDGDGIYGPGDTAVPDVSFVAFNQTAATDKDGVARLSGLGSGRGVSLQIDSSTLPDIEMAPATEGIEIVPRPGRIHAAEFAIVSLSEIDGTVNFAKAGQKRGVSGVRLQLKAEDGQIVSYAKTEMDGYYFFERVKPGRYSIVLDQDQAQKLKLCADQDYTLTIGYQSDLFKRDIEISTCGA